jgi:hypothetical protein
MLTADLVANLLIAQFFPSLMAWAGAARTFAGLGVLALAALVFASVTAPETKGRQLEEIQDYWRNGGRWPEPAASTTASPRSLGDSAVPPTTTS